MQGTAEFHDQIADTLSAEVLGRSGGRTGIFRCRHRAMLVDGTSAGRPGCPIEAPRRHMRLERDLEGRDQDLKLLERQAGKIQKLRRARLHIGKPYTGPSGYL